LIRICSSTEREVSAPSTTTNRVCDTEGVVNSQFRLSGINLTTYEADPGYEAVIRQALLNLANRQVTGNDVDGSDLSFTSVTSGSVVVNYDLKVPDNDANDVFSQLQDFNALMAELIRLDPVRFGPLSAGDIVCNANSYKQMTALQPSICLPVLVCDTSASNLAVVDDDDIEEGSGSGSGDEPVEPPVVISNQREYTGQEATLTSNAGELYLVCSIPSILTLLLQCASVLHNATPLSLRLSHPPRLPTG
jgi:hypothetical protein